MSYKTKIIIAAVNICLGGYLIYDAWQKGGIYIPTQLFAGCVMVCFAVSLLLVPEKKPGRHSYTDTYETKK